MKSYGEVKHELKPEEIQLNELMSEYRQTKNELNAACHLLDIQLENLQEERDAIASSYIYKLNDLEMKMRLPMLERKATFICSYGKINFRNGAIRRTWNLDALDQICEAKPEIKSNIWPFRSETTSEPSITVKLVDEEATT